MQISKTLQRILSLLTLAGFLIAGNAVLRAILEPISYATYFCHDLKELEKDGETVDLVFVGASRVYRSFVPEVFEESLGMDCVINAGSSSQPISATYWQLKDLLERFHPKQVILGVTWNQLIEETSTQGALIVYDRLNGLNKLRCGIDCLKDKDIFYMLYPYRFRGNLGKAGVIYTEKKALAAANYMPDISAGSEYYADKGFIYSRRTIEPGNIEIRNHGSFSTDAILEENLRYLDACVALCEKSGVALSLVTGPTSMMMLYNVNNYQGAVDFYTQYAKDHELNYYNLNYLQGREEFLPDTLMHDYNHVNGEGAYAISRLYSEILKKDAAGIDTSGYFYKDFTALKADVNRIVAVGANVTLEGKNQAHIEIVSLQNDDIILFLDKNI